MIGTCSVHLCKFFTNLVRNAAGPAALFNDSWWDLSMLLFQIEKNRWINSMIHCGMDQRRKLWERKKSLIPFASARQSWNWSGPINRWNHSLLLSETWPVSRTICFHYLAEFDCAKSSTLCCLARIFQAGPCCTRICKQSSPSWTL